MSSSVPGVLVESIFFLRAIEVVNALEDCINECFKIVFMPSPERLLSAGLVYKAMGFPTQYFTVLFAIPRVAGYLAHWKESLNDPDTKIIRPQQDYKASFVPLFRHSQTVLRMMACLTWHFSQDVTDKPVQIPPV